MSVALLQQQHLEQGPAVPAPVKPYVPNTILTMPGHIAGKFQSLPKGVILHGSRSGSSKATVGQEFSGTAAWAQNSSHELGWNATIGSDAVAIHIEPQFWGWNARKASSVYLAVEFAQAVEDWEITDAQVRAFCWYFLKRLRDKWPNLPAYFPTHAEVEKAWETGAFDGKTDVFSSKERSDALRARISRTLQGPEFK